MRDGIWESGTTLTGAARNESDLPFIERSEESVFEWLKNDIEDKIDSRQDRLELIERLDRMYEGEPYDLAGSRRSDLDDEGDKRKKVSIFNYVNEMVEAKLSQRARFKPAFQIIPNKVDVDDEFRAQSVKSLLMAKGQELGIDRILTKGDKENFIAGESYTYIFWNKYKGGLTTIQEHGVQSEEFYRGDVDINVLGPDRCFIQLNKERFEDVDDVDVISFVHIDELKADYPLVADKLIEQGEFTGEDAIRRGSFDSNYLMVVEYYRRPTRFLPTGAYFKFTSSAILEGDFDYPLKDTSGRYLNTLPIVYDTDMDLRGKLGGKPFTSNIERLQRLHDMLASSTARGFAIGNSPKWVYPKGAVDPNKLSNRYSNLEYKGPLEPKLVNFTALPQGADGFMSSVERGIEKGSAVFAGSRGEVPKRIESAVALQFLDEQEMARESNGMTKRKDRALAINKMLLARVQQHYTKEDGRIFKYLGEDNAYMINSFEDMDITGDFEIMFENSSALPDTKSGRIAAILDLNQATQNNPLFTREQISQMLDLGNDKRFKDSAQASLRAGQTKLQSILFGGEAEPMQFDDFITEYPMFVKALRERVYKADSPEIKEKLIRYITGMEGLIWQKAKLNPLYGEMISRLIPEYPIFIKIPLMTPPPSNVTPAINSGAVTKMPTVQKELEKEN